MSARAAAEWVLGEVGLALTRVVDDAGWQDSIDEPELFSRARFQAVAAALAPMAAARLARLRGEAVPTTTGRIADLLLRELGDESVLARAYAEAPSPSIRGGGSMPQRSNSARSTNSYSAAVSACGAVASVGRAATPGSTSSVAITPPPRLRMPRWVRSPASGSPVGPPAT